MSQLSFHTPSIPVSGLPIFENLKNTYLLWFDNYSKLPKQTRYSLGQKIDSLFIDVIESVAGAAFLTKTEKLPYLRVAIRKTDTIKIFLQILWEIHAFNDSKYLETSTKLAEIGKMLGGWHGQVLKQTPNKGAQ